MARAVGDEGDLISVRSRLGTLGVQNGADRPHQVDIAPFILAADVVGYSGQMERDEAGTFERLRAGRKELFEPEIARHHGHIFKLMGDGLLAEFGSANHPAPTPAPDAAQAEVTAWVTRREQIQAMLVAECARRIPGLPASVLKDLKASIARLEKALVKITAHLAALVGAVVIARRD